MKKWLVPALAALLVTGAGGVLVYSRLAEPPPAPPAAAPAAADTVEVRKTDLSTSVTVSGTIGYGQPVTFTGRRAGTLTWLPAPGTVIGAGKKLYTVDAKPVPLLLGSTPLYRKLDVTVTPGPDVRELLTNLRAFGYRVDAKGDKFTPDTEAALKRWQKANGMDETGFLDVGDAVVLPSAVRIDALKAQPGASAAAELFGYTGVGKSVTAQIDPAQLDVAAAKPGAKVTLVLPGGAQTTGVVTTLAPAPQGQGTETGTPKQIATITIDDQNAAASMDSGQVQVKLPGQSRTGVLAVPVTALLALGEGGYAVQVAERGGTRLVAVRTGMFAGDLVEVSGTGLTEGLRVVRAS
ncbi:peptidoglycan-binding protein [Amycolatopsis balhimycina DSM 5908]|uniref:Peptidoglycan-binding protein n=1 Tax=Amycolatopsis balhimycina DSM 5908 TaxID=1081091 RepID=A0A428WEJ2_AMYBA|nr:peptidoglycan-binding protein [Amycolatopsis balhimycina]RSM41453.1 peptidoglycan-binding protein [Amycolatopsis balhimycina DSM 5908]